MTSSQTTCPFHELSGNFVQEGANDPFTHLSDPQQIKKVLGDPVTFAPANALTAVTPISPAALRILLSYKFSLPEVLASASGQLHRTVRSTVASFLTPQKVRAQEQKVRYLVRQELSNLAPETTPVVDLTLTMFQQVPTRVLWDLLGISPELLAEIELDTRTLHDYSLDALELFWGWPDDARQHACAHSVGALHRKLQKLVQLCDGDSSTLFGRLLEQGIERHRVTSLAFFLSIAGQYTTSLLQATTLCRAVDETYGVGLGQCMDFVSAQGLVQKVLARESSVPTWRRYVTEDIEVGGMHFTAGDEILLELSTADTDITGKNMSALAFGWGLHRCLGALLAELETSWTVHEIALWLAEHSYEFVQHRAPEWVNLLSYRAPAQLALQLRQKKMCG